MNSRKNLLLPVLLAWITFIVIVTFSVLGANFDYVGKDNDDVMRLVQVRDWLNGQSWFDLNQYRLGMEGGTLMHWSRLVDLPLGILISFFSLFVSPFTAETIAVLIWPPLTAIFVVIAFARIGQIFNEKTGAIFGAIGAIAYLIGTGKFKPGAIDHHHLQLAAIALIVAIVLNPKPNWKSYAIAGLLTSLAIAIGAETLPIIATICAIVALNWAWHGGKIWRRPTRVFALSLGFCVTLIYFTTTPPHLYRSVSCDALSFGYYSLTLSGSALLFLSVALASYKSRVVRFGCLGLTAILVGALAIIIAPQCLQSPLADLDPLLIKMWLNNVTEAQSFNTKLNRAPFEVAGFYAVPFIALVLCIQRIFTKQQVGLYLKFFTLILIAFIISLIQVRGSIFSNLLAIMPMIGLVISLREQSNANPKDTISALAFIGSVFISLPICWAMVGAGFEKVFEKQITETATSATSQMRANCKTAESLASLANVPDGVVLAPSNLGASILRHTNHRVLSAPYHRNQVGLLTEIKTALADPDDALQIMKDASVNYVAFCPSDPQVSLSSRVAPAGLYAQLRDGKVPDYLEEILVPEDTAIKLYRLK